MTSSPSRSRLKTQVAFVLAVVMVVAHSASRAQTPVQEPLQYANGFLLTGNYVVGGVDLPKAGGIGTIPFNAALGNTVPAGADVVAAYLYWETISGSAEPITTATFRGQPLRSAKASTLTALPGQGAACWGAAGGATSTLVSFRADVLHMLPKQLDANGQWTGKYYVNDADLLANGLPLHTVTLPQQGTGNVVTQSAGASLVLVYRDLSEPLRKIVLYDGPHATAEGAAMTQTIRGFYASSAAKSARITHIVGSGANNPNERLFFNNSLLAVNPFPGPIESSADRGWANPTFDVSTAMPGPDSNDGYGERVTTTVDHGGASRPYECLAWTAVVFSTAVADVDADGLPDRIEDAVGGLNDPPTRAQPNGQPLPNLNQMGASSAQRDLFVEINAMWAPPGTTYGSANAPFNSQTSQITDPNGHNHLPAPEVLKLVGDAYAANGITPHFDVGDLSQYYETCAPGNPSDPRCHAADAYLIPSALARGGEAIQERACSPTGAVRCQFPDYPGTVGWRFGLQLYQDAPVGDQGEELDTNAISSWSNGTRRRRFDRARADFFHYVLYAHARGKAKSALPCLDALGTPIGYDLTSPVRACTRDNPQFHVPSSVSGIADLPGNAVLITLGLWDNFLGTPFVQASTTLHELGHNLNLWHGGAPPMWGDRTRATRVEPNCKPNYLSSMSYLFQVHGLWDDGGNLHLDYSGTAFGAIGEGSLSDGPLFPDLASGSFAPVRAYQPVWYAPFNSALATTIGASAAPRFCSGTRFDPNAAPAPMARVRALTSWSPIDWNGDGRFDSSAPQDVNFDGRLDSGLRGYDDWANVRLNQMGAVRKVRVYSDASGDFLDFGSGDFLDFGSGDFLDFGSGDFLDFGSGTYLVHFGSGDFLDFGSGDFLDFGSGDFLDFGSGVLLQASGDFLDFGSGDFLDFGSGDFLDFGSGDFLDFGSGDFLDFGAGDFLDFGSGNGLQELDYEAAKELGRTAPSGLVACIAGQDSGCLAAAPNTPSYHRVSLTWRAPTLGQALAYHVYRVTGSTITALSTSELIGTTSNRSFVDTEELPNGVPFTYFVKAEFDDGVSGASNFAVITAVNDAPVANNDSFSTYQGSAISINVLDNDTDVDSSHANVRAALVLPAAHGSVVLNPDGSFTYTPDAAYQGSSDSFTYKANNGQWRGADASPDSNIATVSITVISRRTTTIVTSSLNPSTYGESLTFTATVIPDSPVLGTPSGTVTFKDGATTLGTAPLVGNSASWSTASLLSAGSHAITAVYCGGTTAMCGAYYGSTSSELMQTVNPAPVTATAGSGSAISNGALHSPSACVVAPIAPNAYKGSLTCSNNPAAAGPAVGVYTITPAVNANGETLTNFAITSVNGSFTILPPPNKPPVCTAFEARVKTGGSATLTHNCTDPDGDAITVTAVNSPALGNTTLNANGSFTYSIASPTVGADNFTYTVSDGQATATGAVTMRVIYGFMNVQNLPPDGKVFNRGSTIPLFWRWTNNAGTALDSAGALPIVTAFACSTGGQLPGGHPLGTFTPDLPGSGNSFSYSASTMTWQFNWKLTYTVTDARGRTNTYNLPVGTYVLRIKSGLTGQIDPDQAHTCANGQTVSGALITVVR